MEKREYPKEENFESVTTTLEPQSAAKRKKNKSKNKRRFSDEQISLLESIFEADSKLEPRRKVQIARELGLQPRQVAIWFQNRRARWKSKQIEHDFRILRADYASLASRFESLKEEKESLLMQLEKLNDLVGKAHDGNMEGNSTADGSSYKDGNCETAEVRPSNAQEDLEQSGVMAESEKNNTRLVDLVGDYEDDEGHEFLSMGHADATQDWQRFDSGILFEPSRCSSQWLNFWT